MKKPKRFLIVLLSILCLFAILAFTACGNVEQNGNEQSGNTEQGGDIEDNKPPQSQGGNENNEPPQSQKQDYDMSGVVFNDLIVEYDGYEHSIIATNLPEGVTATYENNGKINAGTYTVTAHFAGDSESYNPIPDKTATLTINKATYDMSGVVFNDLTVEYDGQEHSIIATDLPAGVTVSYNGNNQTEIGTYTVTAHFTGDSKNYNVIHDQTAKLTILEPPTTEIVSASGFDIDYSKETPLVSCTVSNSTKHIDLSNKITVTVNCTWKLYKDFIGENELVLKSMNLETGHNIAYIIVYASNGDFVRYEVDIYRLDMKSYTFKNDNSIHTSGTSEEKSAINAPATPEKLGYSFVGWAVEGSSDIVQFPYTVTENITFVAQYIIINYTITYHLDGGENNKGNPGSYNINTSDITLLPAYHQDYVFMGWYSDKQFTTQITVITCGSYGNKDLYAKWIYATEGLTYSLSKNEYAVSGYNGISSDVVIPEKWNDLPVTSISSYAFDSCTILTSIRIPNAITSIGDYAFYDCTNLVSVTIPNSVTTVNGYAFSNCSSLKSVTIGDSVTTINGYAFSNCSNLETIYWNAINCTKARNDDYYSSVFIGCTALKTVIFGDNVQNIPHYAFSDCTSLESVTIGESVTSIGGYVFRGCTSLVSVIIPDSIISINMGAFSDCTSLKSITIGDSVTTINGYAFSNCSNLKTVYWNATNCTSAGTFDSPIFRGCSVLTTVIIGDNVQKIPNYAFSDCTSLTSITIPDRVTSIGYTAFGGCTSLETVYWNAYRVTVDGIFGVGGIFNECTALKTVIFGDNVYIIPDSLFSRCASLESVTIGENSRLTSIGRYAFFDCINLTSIRIPESVTSIGLNAFAGCTSLKTVYWNARHASIEVSGWIRSDIFDECTNLKTIIFGDTVEMIPSFSFSRCVSLESLVVSSGNSIYHSSGDCIIETASRTLILGCKNSVIPTDGSVTSIGNEAFSGCTSLTSITIPDSVTSIGTYAFSECTSLTEVIFENANGWRVNEIDISSSSLNSPATAAYYLTDLYCNYNWTRKN